MAKKYEKIEGAENKYIKYEVDYEKGGMNYYNGATDKRGYYLYVRIVEREPSSNGFQYEKFLMFGGTKKLLIEVARKSDKKYQEAIKLAEQYETQLKEYVLSKEKV